MHIGDHFVYGDGPPKECESRNEFHRRHRCCLFPPHFLPTRMLGKAWWCQGAFCLCLATLCLHLSFLHLVVCPFSVFCACVFVVCSWMFACLPHLCSANLLFLLRLLITVVCCCTYCLVWFSVCVFDYDWTRCDACMHASVEMSALWNTHVVRRGVFGWLYQPRHALNITLSSVLFCYTHTNGRLCSSHCLRMVVLFCM